MNCISGRPGLLPAALIWIGLTAGLTVQDANAAARIDPRLRSLRERQEETRQVRLQPETAKAGLSVLYPGIDVLPDRSGLSVDCLMLLGPEGESSLRAQGLSPRTRVGDIVTITIPLDALDLIETLPGIREVEMSRPLKPVLDVSRIASHADQANGSTAPPFPATGYTGRNVVVGIVDTGIDLQHGDFRDPSNQTRINFCWDQTSSAGTKPQPFNYGSEWTAAQINAGTAIQSDFSGHGTHVAGIAAGDGSDTGNGQPADRFIGVAPESDIIFVKTTFLTGDVTDAVSYIFSKAGVRPAVVNLSLGTQDGPHDGTSLFDQAISNLTGAGRIIVAAAGNEGNPTNNPNTPNIHARQIFSADTDSMVFTFTIPTYTPNPGTNPLNDFIVIDGWYEGADNFSFRVESPAGKRTNEVLRDFSFTTCINGTQEGRVYIENNKPVAPPSNGDNEIYIEITEPTSSFNCGLPKSGTWKIIAYRKGPIVSGVIDFWISAALLGAGGGSPSFGIGAANSHIVGSPASALNVISVGAYITKRQWTAVNGVRQYVGMTDADIGRIASFSSPGPLRDGTPAPDLVAPGQGIASARSSAATTSNDFNLTDGKHHINQGTSQASPQVAGAVALLLERYPTETPTQIRTRLKETARRDSFTGTEENNTYGAGKLEVMKALEFGTPVYLGLLEAFPDNGNVRLRWIVQGDDPFLGFHVSRSRNEAGPFERLTESLLTGGPRFEFLDDDVTPGTDYWYLVESLDLEGRVDTFGPLLARAGAPRLSLLQNGPNPFSTSTTIAFDLPVAGTVGLKVFDISGKPVRTLADGILPAGRNETIWDGTGDDGRDLPNGVYFYRLASRSGSETRKMILKRP